MNTLFFQEQGINLYIGPTCANKVFKVNKLLSLVLCLKNYPVIFAFHKALKL